MDLSLIHIYPLMAVLYPGHPLTSRKHLSYREVSGCPGYSTAING